VDAQRHAGRSSASQGGAAPADFTEVDDQALDTLGLRLVRGRGIERRDIAGAPWVAVINQTFADRHLAGQNPLGQTIRVSIGWGGQPGTFDEPQARQIIGVVADVAYPSYFTQTPAVVYVPFRQHLKEYGSEDQWLHTRKALLVRSSGDSRLLIRSIGEGITAVDSEQTASGFATMNELIERSPSVSNARFLTSLFAVFGTLAILLAMVGVYGVVSWVVGRRATEVGIRMALGAEPLQVTRMLLSQALWPVLLGIVLGLGGGIALSKVLNGIFWEMTTPEPAGLAGIAVMMLGAALSAAWVPMRRVLTLDPNRVLRAD
jgi:putative ABC transport system permease protein